MNKNITVNEVYGGWGCTVDIFSPHTIHLRVKIREFILFIYRYGYFEYHLICISASSVCTQELLLSAAIIFWQFFKICMWSFSNVWN